MSARAVPNVLSIPVGAPFLPALVDALFEGRLVPDFRFDCDPLALADVTIYVPTRRAARELRSTFMERAGKGSVILPSIRPLGEFDEDEALFSPGEADLSALSPPIAAIDRLLLLAPLARAWKSRLPAHVAELFAEPIVVPASASDALWLARDLAALMDEVETEGSDWRRLKDIVTGDLAAWWQVTLEFLDIVTMAWPSLLQERGLSNPAEHRTALIRAEAARLRTAPLGGPVIAAGSTGSIPATADLLSVIARLPRGAVVLPGLDKAMDDASWSVVARIAPEPAILGHPQYGLSKLIRHIGIERGAVDEISRPGLALAVRAALVGEAFRPAETTSSWAGRRQSFAEEAVTAALAGITLVEAANERDEAACIAIALRRAIAAPGKSAALVTSDRDLARRVSMELRRFGIRADDSGGTRLASTAPAALLRFMVKAVFQPGDPVSVLSLIRHPLLSLGLDRAAMRQASETIELVALRGGTGRPDATTLAALFDTRLDALKTARQPFWMPRMTPSRLEQARDATRLLEAALAPLAAFVGRAETDIAAIVRATVMALENLARAPDGGVDPLYAGEAGDKLASLLRGLVAATADFSFAPAEWPDVLDALIAPEVVKPGQGSDSRVAIWGALEARLLSPDTLIVGGLNEGVWPRKAEADRFMSRIMKTGIDLEPPERRIGQSAHDIQMAFGVEHLILTRSARSADAPSVASRWLQRILTFAGKETAAPMRARGDELLGYARQLDARPPVDPIRRPEPTPPLATRPRRFSVTEIETLRRDPYAIYARRILGLAALDPLLREPGAAERGTLFHAILHRFAASGVDPAAPTALDALTEAGRVCFAEAALPPEVQAVWWPRFARLTHNVLAWEGGRPNAVLSRHPEERASATEVGSTGVMLSGYADRIDVLPAGMADIIDYKTGTTPSKTQAHRLIAPQLALEAALLSRSAFLGVGKKTPADLAYIRLKANGEVVPESILTISKSQKSALELSEDAWRHLEKLLNHYAVVASGYKSRALPFREGDTDGDYDHLARVLEWSAGGDREGGDEE